MKSVFIVLLVLSPLAFAEPGCEHANPVDFAKGFVKKHKSFYFEETANLKHYVNPLLYKALKSHYRCAETQGVCHLDYDPWTGAQDGDIVEATANFVAKAVNPSLYKVTMTYQFEIQPGQPRKMQNLQLMLRSSAAPLCWQVTDMITPLGDSMLKALLQKQNQ